MTWDAHHPQAGAQWEASGHSPLSSWLFCSSAKAPCLSSAPGVPVASSHPYSRALPHQEQHACTQLSSNEVGSDPSPPPQPSPPVPSSSLVPQHGWHKCPLRPGWQPRASQHPQYSPWHHCAQPRGSLPTIFPPLPVHRLRLHVSKPDLEVCVEMLALHLQHGHVPATGELRQQHVTAPAALPRAPTPHRAPRNGAAASPHPHAKRN